MRRRWQLIPPRDEAARLRTDLGISPLQARLLTNRGVDLSDLGVSRPRLSSHHARLCVREMPRPRTYRRSLGSRASGITVTTTSLHQCQAVRSALSALERSLCTSPSLRDGYGLTEKGVRCSRTRARVMLRSMRRS